MFFEMTAELLSRVRKNKVGNKSEYQNVLSEHLIMVWCLTKVLALPLRFYQQLGILGEELIKLKACSQLRKENLLLRKKQLPMREVYLLQCEKHGVALEDPLEHIIEGTDKLKQTGLLKLSEAVRNFERTLNSEAWSHLENYTYHWLIKLEGGSDGFNEVMRPICKIGDESYWVGEPISMELLECKFCQN